MAKVLLIAGGILNFLFFALHVSMFYGLSHAPIAADIRGLLYAFNVAGSMTLLFFTWVSFSSRRELLETRLGRVVLVLVALYYLARASEEFYWFPYSHVIFWPCVATGALYAAVLVMAVRTPAAVTAEKMAMAAR